MKKNFLFGLLALMLAWFWFGGVSLASTLTIATNPSGNQVEYNQEYRDNGFQITDLSSGADISLFARAIDWYKFDEATITSGDATIISNWSIGRRVIMWGNDSIVTFNFTMLCSSESAVACIWDFGYSTLAWAIAAAQDGDTVTLLSDVTLTSGLTIPVGKSITLNIWEYNIKAWNSDSNNIKVQWTLILTWTTWKIYSEDDYDSNHWTCVIVADNGWDFIMNWWKIEVVRPDPVNKWQFWVCVYWDWSSVEINWWEIQAWWYAISWNWSEGNDWTIVTVNGWKLISTADYAIYNPQDGEVIINEWAFVQWAAWAVAIFDWNIEINGGLLTSIWDWDTWDWWDWTSLRWNETLIIGTNRSWYWDVSVVISWWTISAAAGVNVINLVDTKYNVTCKIKWWIFSSDPSDYIDEWYTVLEKENKFYVMSLEDAATDESNTEKVQLPEWVTVNTWAWAETMDISDIESYLSWWTIGTNVTIEEEVLTWEIQDDWYQNVAVAWTVLLDFWGNAVFSRPIAIRIPVSWTNPVKVKVKHGTAAYWYTWLTLNPDATCNTDWSVASSAYAWTDITPVAGYAVIYTCSASTFVAYTETTAAPATTPSSSSSWWGGGGSSSYSCKSLPANAVANNTSKPKKNTNYSYSTDTGAVCTFQCKSGYTWNEKDEKCEKSEETVADTNENTDNADTSDSTTTEDLKKVLDDGYTVEFHNAYDFAFKNGITTMPSIDEAHMNSPLTRIAMAKMLSQYAINVLWKKPANVVVPNFPDVSPELDAEYNNGVTLAYQLWIMWINIENFRPDDLVTRAEFATALSRLLYNTPDGEWAYYETHLKKLMEEKVITVADPDMHELRGYVMIMLMRSAKNS